MVTYRIDRINKEFLRLISEMLRTRVKKKKVGDAILTNVTVSRDLGYARVYYTLLEKGERGEVQKALESSASQIRGMLGRELHLRTIPELHFVYDDSEEKARAMDALLDRVAAMDADRAAEPQGEDAV